MNGQLERLVTARESKTEPTGPMLFLMLFGDEPVPEAHDERSILRVPWMTVDVAKARGWR
jgi:hypothetical protein